MTAHAQAPANDNFANAQLLTSRIYFDIAGDNTSATGEPGEQAHGSAYAAQSSIWFSWTAPDDGTIIVSTVGSRGNTTHAVYTGNTLSTLTRIAQDSTSSSDAVVKRPVAVTAGSIYFIAVGALNGPQDRGPIRFQLSFLEAVRITAQPADRIATIGDSVTFTVTASGRELTYQWSKNGRAIAGTTAASLTFNNVQVPDAGIYRVTVTSLGGTSFASSVTSDAAILRGANPLPSLTTQPSDRLATAGTAVSFSVAATSVAGGNRQYQWRRNGFDVPGATGNTLTISSASRSDIDVYDVRVNDGLSVTYSDRVRLDVQPSATPQGFGLDPAFSVSLEMEGGSVSKLRRGPDGKVLIAGSFLHYDGATKPNLARLNSDGSLDSTFVGATFDGEVSDVAVQPDGKLIVIGSFTQIDELRRSRVARLNQDGTPDAGFTLGPTLSVRALSLVLLQADGRILLAGDFSAPSDGTTRNNLIRLLPDGALDAAYNPNPTGAVNSLALQSDGKIIVGGAFTNIGSVARRYLTRLNSDGTNDSSFDVGTGPSGTIAVVKLTPDGSTIICGSFNQFNGMSSPGVLRLRSDGTRDPTFVGANPTGFIFGDGSIPVAGGMTDLALLADGKMIIVGSFQFLNGRFGFSGSYGFARLNSDGSPDFTFSTDFPIAGGVSSVLVLDDGRVLLGGALHRFTFSRQLGGVAAFSMPAGKLDPSVRGTFIAGSVGRIVPVAGGRILVSGLFSRVNGVARSWLVRLHSDGSLDPTFVASLNDSISDIAVQGDGRIVITGAFTDVGGTARNHIARLNADGALDASFNFRASGSGGSGGAPRVASLAEGRVLLAGGSLSSLISGRRSFARLHADGSLDTSFVSSLDSSGGGSMSDYAVLPDERLLYTNDGSVSSGGIKPPVLGRLNQDGRTDSSFTPGTTPIGGSGVYTLALMPDGRILIGGGFTSYNNTARNRIARLLPDGTVDPSFNPSVSSTITVTRLLPARDDILYVLRQNSLFGPRPEPPLSQAFTRITSGQQIDSDFVVTFAAPSTGAYPALLLDDGNLLLVGETFSEGSVTRKSLMRTRPISGVSILSQPVATTISAGANLTLSVTAGGASDLTYQWFKDGAPIDGAERSTYSATAAHASAAGSYFVRISYPGGTIDSSMITVTVNESAPVFSSASPTPAGFVSTMEAGTRYALTAPALSAGSTPLSYQWSKDGVPLAGETGAALFRAAWSVADAGAYRVVITNSRGSITSQALQQNVADTADWTWVHPQPQGNPVSLVTYLNGRFIASGTSVLVSTNGREWKLCPIAGSTSVGPVVYGNGTYVALTAFGGILTSPDAVNWTARESNLTDGRSLARIAFGGGRFVAVGAQGAVRFSSDAITWSASSLPVADAGAAITYGAGQFLAVASRGMVFSSTDGATWVRRAVLPENVAYAAYGAGVFATASVESASIFTSPDGITWTRRPSGATSAAAVRDLQYADGGFLASLATTAARYLASADGLTWVEKISTSSLNSPPFSVTRGSGTFVMAAGAPDLLLWSSDGVLWNRVAPAEGRSFRAIATDGTTTVAVGTAQPPIGPALSALVRVTYDGTTWFGRSSGISAALNDVAHGGAPANTFVAVGNTGSVITSPDGNTWATRSSGVNSTLRGVKYVNGRFLAVGDGAMLSSTDGATWTRIQISGTPTLYQVAYGAGAYVAVGTGGTVLRSTDAAVWSPQPSGANGTLVDVIFAAGKFVAVGTTGEIVTSVDGISWTPRKSNALALTSCAFAGDRFLALGTSLSYFESSDGETWSSAQHGSAQTLTDLVEFKNRLVGVGNFGSILTQQLAPPPGATLPVVTAQTPDQSVRTGQSITLTISAAGLPAPAYQWLKDGVSIPGATAAELVIASARVSDTGSYACVVSTAAGAITSGISGVRVVLAAKLSNLSVRSTLAAAQALTVGFTVGDGGSQWILVRAAGPALAAFGVGNAMADPKIELYSRGQKIAENDNWGTGTAGAEFARVGAFAFPNSSRDAAWVGPLVDNVTAVASGTGPGVILVECYDTGLTSAGSTRFTNLSARNHVGSGADVLIAGLSVSGTGSVRVLVRGVGPALSAFGVGEPLANPKLELYDSNGAKISENDDWPAALSPTFASVGAFALPSGSRDAALVATLAAPGSYTVQVSGAGATTGEALVEIYELP